MSSNKAKLSVEAKPGLPPTWVSTALPPAPRNLLVVAAAKGSTGSYERTCAIEHAVARVKRAYPQFFK